MPTNKPSSVEFVSFDSSVVAGTTGNYEIEVETGDRGSGDDLDVEIKAFLYVAGTNDQSIVDSIQTVATENDIVNGTLSFNFPTNESRNYASPTTGTIGSGYPRTDEPIWVKVKLQYFGAPGFSRGNTADRTVETDRNSVQVTQPVDQPQVVDFDQQRQDEGDQSLSDTFTDQTPFSIREIEFEEDAEYVLSVFQTNERVGQAGLNAEFIIGFDFPNPSISIDGAGRFAKHEIIGGSTVRQKIGEEPLTLSISGVCKQRTANQIDSLRDAKSGKIYSNRMPGNGDSLRVQFGSTSTEPMSDGGAADFKDGELLYTFSINAIEVIR